MRWKSLLTICCLSWCISTQAQPRELQISVGDWPPYLSTDQRHNGVMAHIISDLFEHGFNITFPYFRLGTEFVIFSFDLLIFCFAEAAIWPVRWAVSP